MARFYGVEIGLGGRRKFLCDCRRNEPRTMADNREIDRKWDQVELL